MTNVRYIHGCEPVEASEIIDTSSLAKYGIAVGVQLEEMTVFVISGSEVTARYPVPTQAAGRELAAMLTHALIDIFAKIESITHGGLLS